MKSQAKELVETVGVFSLGDDHQVVKAASNEADVAAAGAA
jgi:hypothetical protein